MSDKTILVVDDESSIREMITTSLEIEGFSVLQAENAKNAHVMILDKKPDLILLDWMMPETSGIELMRRLKRDEITKDIPIIMLTARITEDNMVQGLESGADDYISKPFSPKNLNARIKAILRRFETEDAEQIIEVDQLKFDPISHLVTISDEVINLGPTEFKLLKFFLMHQNRVYSRDQIIDHVWGQNIYVDERTIDVHIRRLRKAIMVDKHDRLIQTIRGSGYRFSSNITEQSED
jgi:two-component system phosphate regulon response regulator PhoB|tara:strand:- start:14113 stop:14823 length:711 start_codon:yes stop_codon:yes gene_type:complete